MVEVAESRITGQGLFADVRGDVDSPAVLFLHGGPGQGAYEFMAVQGDRLGAAVRVIGLDQRGVDRSAPLPAGSGLTIADVVEDCESVRQALDVERWVVLGQSFGGMLALRYAANYPGAVRAVVFENPVWDAALTARAALRRIAGQLVTLGHGAQARAVRAAAGRDGPPQELWAEYVAALRALGDGREGYFLPDPGTRQLLRQIRLARSRSVPDGDQPSESTIRHHEAFLGDDAAYQSLLPLLPGLAMPALLITGGQDPTTSPEQRDAFRRGSPRHAMVEFQRAGHFVHANEPDRYARTIIKFVRGEGPDGPAGP
jgi:proline iminopeptidase